MEWNQMYFTILFCVPFSANLELVDVWEQADPLASKAFTATFFSICFASPRCAKSRAKALSAGNHLYTSPCPQSWAEQPFRWAVRMTHPPTHRCGCAQKDIFHLTQNPHRGPITCAVIGSLGNVGGGSQKSLPFFFSIWHLYTQQVELELFLYTRKANIPCWCLETVLFGHPNRSEDRKNWPN